MNMVYSYKKDFYQSYILIFYQCEYKIKSCGSGNSNQSYKQHAQSVRSIHPCSCKEPRGNLGSPGRYGSPVSSLSKSFSHAP
jgi:hypothetical protein